MSPTLAPFVSLLETLQPPSLSNLHLLEAEAMWTRASDPKPFCRYSATRAASASYLRSSGSTIDLAETPMSGPCTLCLPRNRLRLARNTNR